MSGNGVKGILAFIGLVLLSALLLFGFLVIAAVILVVTLLFLVGFYIYVRVKLWRLKRHPPKELEGPEDYV